MCLLWYLWHALTELYFERLILCFLQLSSRRWTVSPLKRTVPPPPASSNKPWGRRTGTIKYSYHLLHPPPLLPPFPHLLFSNSPPTRPHLPPSPTSKSHPFPPLLVLTNFPLRPPPPPLPHWMGRQPKWTPACPWRSRGKEGEERTYLFIGKTRKKLNMMLI